MDDDTHLQKTLHSVGSPLADDLNAWLGQEFGGLDVSGGEWLRIAIARGLFSDSQFIVLDEPTAAIDPIQEVEMIRQLLREKDIHARRSSSPIDSASHASVTESSF